MVEVRYRVIEREREQYKDWKQKENKWREEEKDWRELENGWRKQADG